MKKHLVFVVLCAACSNEPFAAFGELDAIDGGAESALDGDSGGGPSAAGAAGEGADDGGQNDAGPSGHDAGGSGGSGSSTDAGHEAGSGGDHEGTDAAGGALNTGGTDPGGAGGEGSAGAANTGGSAGAPNVELCCKFSGAETTYLSCDVDEPWLCNGAQTYSCAQDGLCGLGATCYKSTGPFGGSVAECP